MSFYATLNAPLLTLFDHDISLFFLLQVLVTFLCCWCVTLIFSYLRSVSKHAQKTVLILGPAGVGKTCLYFRLIHDGKFGAKNPSLCTVTSLRPNSSNIHLPSGNASLELVDVPGSVKLRALWTDYLASAVGIIYMIHADAMTSLELRSHSEYLFSILSKWKRPKAALLFLVRTSDHGASGLVQSHLNDELKKLIRLKRASLNALDAEWQQNASSSSALSSELFDLSAMSEYELDAECDAVESALPLAQYPWKMTESTSESKDDSMRTTLVPDIEAWMAHL